MKILPQKPLFFHGRVKPSGLAAIWQPTSRLVGEPGIHPLDRIKSLGYTVLMDDYEKRKLGIFNQLNFFQLIPGIIIPIAGAISNRKFPPAAWIVASLPALISVVVLVLNSRRRHDLAQITYFVCYPIA